jgi:ASC-1-like (ASCH) protein
VGLFLTKKSKNMLNQQNIKDNLQTLKEGDKVIFKNEKGKVKVFYLKNGYYYVTLNGNEIETIKDINAVCETVIAILEIID